MMTGSARDIARRFACAPSPMRATVRAAVCCGAIAFLSGCNLLDVSNPLIVEDKDVANPTGANARLVWTLYQFSSQITQAAYDVSILSDERTFDVGGVPHDPPWGNYTFNLDRRDQSGMENLASRGTDDTHLRYLSTMFTNSSLALTAQRTYGASDTKNDLLAELFALRSYTLLQMAEDMCAGFPINDISADNKAILSGPYTTDSAVKYSLAQADSALAYGHDSVTYLNVARVVKGRALLDLGRYADAASAVAAVPTSFSFTTDPSIRGNQFGWYDGCCAGVGERKGGNGLPFVSAQDPRVTSSFRQVRALHPTDSLYQQTKYADYTTPMVLTGGTEARLIEAEAALHEPNPPKMMNILNALRTPIGLPDLALPATTDAQVDLLYRERAFWLYLTGRRVGDLRRLIKNYGRAQDTVFPAGPHPIDGSYGTATSFPFTVAAQGRYNAAITPGCNAS